MNQWISAFVIAQCAIDSVWLRVHHKYFVIAGVEPDGARQAELETEQEQARELGMTMLIGGAVCIGSFAVTITATPEEGGTGGLGPLEGYVDWAQGWANAAMIGIAGLTMIFFSGRDWA